MSLNVNPVNPPVCVDKTAVGMTVHSRPVADMIGNATVNEHLPKHEMSLIASMRFCAIFAIMKIVYKKLIEFNVYNYTFITIFDMYFLR